MSLGNEFVNAMFHELFNKNFELYSHSLNKAMNGDTDSYAKARNALNKLNDSERAEVVNFLKVVIADSASVILGTLDNVYFPDNLSGDFSLYFEGEEIQGDLQDLFIEKAEDFNVYG